MFLNKDKDGFHLSYTSEQLNKALRIAGLICIGMLTLFLLVLTMSAIKAFPSVGEARENGIQNTITVTGQADMEVSPDVTTFTWIVETEGKTSAESQSKAATIGNNAIAYLKQNGIPTNDIKTLSFQTNTKYSTKYVPCEYPQYDSAPSRSAVAPTIAVPPCGSEAVPTGFTTYQSVQVKIRDIDKNPSKAGELAAGLSKIGVKVSDPQSTIDNPDMFKNKVRAEAIAKARQQAQILARDLGVKLVRVTSYNEDGYGYPRPYAAMGSSAKAEAYDSVVPDLPTGTNNVSTSVTITYEIR